MYISCWRTCECLQYDVSVSLEENRIGSPGGIVRHAPHPKQPKASLNGGRQMVEVSRDGRRVCFTNSLHAPWDAQFYPEGHQVRLEGGDASSDWYCYS